MDTLLQNVPVYIVAGVLLIPLVMSLIQFFKRLVPVDVVVPDAVWLGLSFALGLVGWVLASVAGGGLPEGFAGWLGLVVLALQTGLATSKAYDQAKSTPKNGKGGLKGRAEMTGAWAWAEPPAPPAL